MLTEKELDGIEAKLPIACGDPTCNPETCSILVPARDTLRLIAEYRAIRSAVDQVNGTYKHPDHLEQAVDAAFDKVRGIVGGPVG